ncbi:hypothetical protein [Streptomyces sp. NPDC049970]|uniref:hypothetical protein n=1 Tax=Streptomyces sp. NPDC049970 TaxID=3155033 RepID=UPI0034279594
MHGTALCGCVRVEGVVCSGLEAGDVQQPLGKLMDRGCVADHPCAFSAPIALISDVLDAFLLRQRRAVQFVHVGAELKMAAFSCLSAPQFQCIRQARPGDLLTASGGDEAAFVLGY